MVADTYWCICQYNNSFLTLLDYITGDCMSYNKCAQVKTRWDKEVDRWCVNEVYWLKMKYEWPINTISMKRSRNNICQ